MGAGTIEFGADRVRRGRVGGVNAAVRQRLEGDAEIEVRQSVLLVLRVENVRYAVHGAEAAGLDVVIVIANAAIEDHEVIVVGGVEQIEALRIDGDLGWPAGPGRVAADIGERELRIKDIDLGDVSAGGSARKLLRTHADIAVDAGDLARNLDAAQRGVIPAVGVELVSRFRLVREVLGDLIAALRIGAERPENRARRRVRQIRDRRLRQRADVVEHRALKAGLVAQRQIRRDVDLAGHRADILLDAVIVAVDEAVEIVAVGAEIRERAADGVVEAGAGGRRTRPVVRHAEIRQAVQIGMDVARGQLHGVERRPLRGDETAVAIVLDIGAAGDAGILEQSARAHRERRADHLVDVEHHSVGVVGRERRIHVIEAFFGRGLLGHDVDRAAGGAAAGKGRARAAQDFDLLGEEVFAHADAGVAHAV